MEGPPRPAPTRRPPRNEATTVMSRYHLPLAIGLLALTTTAVRAQEMPPAAGHRVDYDREVRPILAKSCIRCHGETQPKGGLVLDERDSALKGGDNGLAIVPGKGAESRLVRYAAGVDDDFVMPPIGSGKPLSTVDVAILRAWIDQGAHWPESSSRRKASNSSHWAFKAPKRPPLPTPRDPTWVRNPIDAFVLARLERDSIRPSPEADREVILRRVCLDLIGLPPTVAELDAFLADNRPDAYERQVDRLLASPHYGERWARRWLDRARYADTNGYEKDRERSIWPYRDWVIDALNRDMPFDRFSVEQLAGDLLPDTTIAQKVATGFHRNTMTNEEGGIDVEEFRFASIVDRVATTSGVWLGLTVQCAQCHTHKYDPITQRDYYRLFAFFNNADEPELSLPSPLIEARRSAIEAEATGLERRRPESFPTHDPALDWSEAMSFGGGHAIARPRLRTQLAAPILPESEARRLYLASQFSAWERSRSTYDWTIRRPSQLDSKKHATFDPRPDGSILVRGDKPNNDVYKVDIEGDFSGVRAIRLEVLPDPSLPDDGPGRAPLFSVGDFILTEFGATLRGSDTKATPIAIARATEDYAEPGHPAALAIDGKSDTGWTVKGSVGRPHAAVFEFREPLPARPGARLRLTIHQDGIHQMTIGRFRVSTTVAAPPVTASGLTADVEASLRILIDRRSLAQRESIFAAFLDAAPELAAINKRISELRRSSPRPTTSLVMEERRSAESRTTQVHLRGEFMQLGDVVAPGVPAILPPFPSDLPKNRLGLARWIVAGDNPVTARVQVNQAWQSFFGRGLVPTVDDFGTRGDAPSHPELLDWLATEFIRVGWSQKAIHRLIVTSATYRQSSKVSPSLLARDSLNDLLARGPRYRVDAETVRDIALAASGLLSPKIGGPSVYPPQPDGVTSLAYGLPTWPTSTGEDRYRRGLYTFTKRTAPYATFGLFDAPNSDLACLRRERSNSPLQALTLLNDPVYVEAARALADRLIRETLADDEARVRLGFRVCLARLPKPEEMASIVAFYRAQRDRARPVESAERTAWTAVARAILNLDETITKE